MTQLMDILNPIHNLTCKDKRDLTSLLAKYESRYKDEKQYSKVDQWWEELTVGKWVEGFPETEKQVKDYEETNILPKPLLIPALIQKEHLVCEVEKPMDYERYLTGKGSLVDAINDDVMMLWLKKCHNYQQAQSKVLIEGFEEYSETEVRVKCGDIYCYIDCQIKGFFFRVSHQSVEYIINGTINDLITELDRYNRTHEPINLYWNQNILPKEWKS